MNNLNLPTVPLTILNQNGDPGDLYVSIVGMADDHWYSVIDQEGNIARCQPSGGLQSFAMQFAAEDEQIELDLPQLIGGRIYFSFGQPLMVNTSPTGIPGAPSGWTRGDPNFRTLFDWVEFSWVPGGPRTGDSTLGANITQVDMFGTAMRLDLDGLDSDWKTPVGKTCGFESHTREAIFDDLLSMEKPWHDLIMTDPETGLLLRIVSPYHGMELGVFPRGFLDGYIGSVFDKYAGGGLLVRPEGVLYNGNTLNGFMTFANAQGGSFQFPKPTTWEAFTGSFVPDPLPEDPVLERQGRAVGAILQGAYLRTTILEEPDLNVCNPSAFYQADPVNEYAAVLHEHGIDHLCYAFGYDDTCDQSSYIGVHNPKSIAVTLF
jgi:glycosyl hydrolase family 64 (putative beta-1,3-glucanase)